jgi:hypothetical protein
MSTEFLVTAEGRGAAGEDQDELMAGEVTMTIATRACQYREVVDTAERGARARERRSRRHPVGANGAW